MYPVNVRAPTSIRDPKPTGLCRRCGFYFPLERLAEQYEWRGPSLGKILTRVCVSNPGCLDLPQEQLRTIIIGPDPIPPRDASPTFYQQQNQGGEPGVNGLALLAIMPFGDVPPAGS